MKKYILILSSTLVLSAVAVAQKKASSEGVTFGIRAGFDLTNLNGKKDNGDKLTNKLQPGFNVGVNAEIPIADEFYIQPNILFSKKGAKNETTILGQTITTKSSLSYLSIPIHFLYKGRLGDQQVLLGFGPYFAFGVGGKVKTSVNNSSTTNSVKYKNTVPSNPGNNAYLKPLDAGASLFAGYGFTEQLSVQLNAQLGLINIESKVNGAPSDKSTLKNTSFGLSLGYRF
jgi:hypothetical protein